MSDVYLLVIGVTYQESLVYITFKEEVGHTGQLNDLASIQQRRGDIIERVRSTDKQYLTQIDGYVHIMILNYKIISIASR